MRTLRNVILAIGLAAVATACGGKSKNEGTMENTGGETGDTGDTGGETYGGDMGGGDMGGGDTGADPCAGGAADPCEGGE
jgi:hypothetical protein